MSDVPVPDEVYRLAALHQHWTYCRRANCQCADAGQSEFDIDYGRRVADDLWPIAFAAGREAAARDIEVNQGDRCPECGGKPASTKWIRGRWEKTGRCGGGHVWLVRGKDYRDPAQLARGQSLLPAGTGDAAPSPGDEPA